MTQQMQSGSLSKLDTQLAAYVYGTRSASLASPAAGTTTTGSPGTSLQPGGSVVLDFTATDGDGAALLASLQSLGLQHGSSFGAVVSGVLPTDDIAALTTLPTLGFASVSAMRTRVTQSQGTVVSQADPAQRADIARSTYGVDGTGLKIGILSDSFNTSGNADSMATDIASHDLPPDTTIRQDYTGGGATDEGRAMAQLAHDIAPNASIAFATAYYGQAGFANNILDLANAGAKVIVDDVTYFADLAYQDGIISQAVNQVAARGVSYFSSAGNDGHLGYEAPFNAGTTPVTFSYNGVTYTADQVGNGQTRIPITLGSSMAITLQWDQPAASAGHGSPGSQSDLDLFMTDANGNVLHYSDGTPIVSTNNNIGHDPVEVINIQGGSGNVYLQIGLKSGPAPTDLKLIVGDNGSGASITEPSSNTNDGTVYGHAAAAGAIAVGAAPFYKTPVYGTTPPVVESFSSGGPTRVSFDVSGNRLATPEIRQTPVLTAVDGVNTTFFGHDIPNDPDTYPNFFGTSAAAPNAAAVALLMYQARSTLTPTDVRNLLVDSSIDMDNPATPGFDTGYDYGTGSGLIQADLAVGYASTLSFTSGDTLHFTDAVLGAFSFQYSASTGLLTYSAAPAQPTHTIALPQNLVGTFAQVLDPNGGVDVRLLLGPPTTTVTSVALSADTGTSSSDFLTDTAAQTISGTLSAGLGVGESVRVSLDNGNTWTTATTQAVGSNTWSLAGQTLTTGTHAIQAEVSNGNGSSTPFVQNYTLDTTAPAIASITLSGSAYGLGDIVNATIALSGSYDGYGDYVLATGSTIDGATLTNVAYHASNNTITGSFTVGSGTTEVINGPVSTNVVVDDAAGNMSVADTTPVSNVTIDTHAPTAVSVAGFTNGATDSGLSGVAPGTTVGALSTADASPGDAFAYTLGGADAGSFAIAGDTLKVGSTPLTSGQTYHFTVTSQDLGGNSYTQNVAVTGATVPMVNTINRAGPAAPTNASSDPFLVSFSEAVSGVSAANFSLSGTDGTGTIGTPSSADGGVTWTVPVTGVSGNGTLGLDLTSTAGIVSTSSGTPLASTHASDQVYTIDTTAPGTPRDIADAAVRNGFVNNANDTAAQALTGTAEAGSTVTVYNGSVALGTTTATSDGHFSYALGRLADGSYRLTATASDAVGNISGASAPLSFVVDTVPPAVAINAPAPGSTSTIIDPVVSGSVNGAAPGSVVTLSEGSDVVGSATVANDGSWSTRLHFDADGSHTLTASDTDPAGNAGQASVSFSIDSTANRDLFGTVSDDASSPAGQVYALYETVLGRAPDPTGLENYVAALAGGTSLVTIAQAMLDSGEYAGRYGAAGQSSNSDFVTELYENGLSREPDPDGRQHYEAALGAGRSRAQVAVDIATSRESQDDRAGVFGAGVFVPSPTDSTIARLYYGLLDRAPDAAGLRSWEQAVAGGTTLDQVAHGFLSSTEYQSTGIGQNNLQFVQQLYGSALGWQGDPNGLQDYQTALDNGDTSRAGVTLSILDSDEFQSDTAGSDTDSYINKVYEVALGRTADPDGLKHYEDAFANGLSRATFNGQIVASDEFRANTTAPAQGNFVDTLYQQVLGRDPDPGGFQNYTGQLASGASLTSVALSVVKSSEAQDHLASRIEAGYQIA